MTTLMLTRRKLAAGIALLPLLVAAARAQAPLPPIQVSKDPSCGCCGGWIEHLKKVGFAVTVFDTNDLAATKRRLRVPEKLASCHTAVIAGYVVEGHVPQSVIRRLLAETPAGARGIAVPGMPLGSPGMEVPGRAPEIYDVILFGTFGERRYARFEGARELPLQAG